MKQDQLNLQESIEDPIWYYKALRSEGIAGKLWVENMGGGELFISLLEVYSDVLVVDKRSFRRLWLYPKKHYVDFQRQGVGTKLLHAMVKTAQDMGMTKIYGYISTEHYNLWPGLPKWYVNEGFTLREPDGKSYGEAIHKIEMML